MEQLVRENRRLADRFAPVLGYSRVTVTPDGPETASGATIVEPKIAREGHLYDISVTGVRLDLDDPLEEGETVALEMHLPGLTRSIKARGRIVRVYDEDGDPGPRRMALTLRSFETPEDATRLARILGSGFFPRES
ncbi:MAG: PilZ domain-containing protein [Phycisphaerales bacterium]|nr:PilZ domain-containing protein [Phycisphaerales bacterium]